MHKRWKWIREEEKSKYTLLKLCFIKHWKFIWHWSMWSCKLKIYSCRPGAHGLCESLESDCTEQLCMGLSVPFVLFIAVSMGRQRDPESHWQSSAVFSSLTCALIHITPLQSDFMGVVQSPWISVGNCPPIPLSFWSLPVHVMLISPQSCANQVCNQANFSGLYITKS